MKLFQVEDPTAMHSTDWFYTVAEASKNAFAQGYSIFSTVIEATIFGHEAMAKTIKNLLNEERNISGRLRVIRSLGSAREVSKEKVIPFVKLVRSDNAFGKTKQCSTRKVLPFVKPMNYGEAEQCLKHKVLPLEKPLPRITRDTIPSGAIGLILNTNGKSYQIRSTGSKLDKDNIHFKADMIGKSWFLYHETPISRVPYGSHRTCAIASGIYPVIPRRSAYGTYGYAFSNNNISKRTLYEIVRVVSGKTLDIRAMKLEALPSPEDMGLVGTDPKEITKTSKKQNWTILPNSKKPWTLIRIRLHKNGVWKDKNGYQFYVAEAEYKHHDYSF